MERVLVPVDGSEQSREALEFALEKFPEATIHLLHVAQVTSFLKRLLPNLVKQQSG